MAKSKEKARKMDVFVFFLLLARIIPLKMITFAGGNKQIKRNY
jgi:hypothetical protein